MMLPMQSVHPLFVHFPIGLLIASFVFECLAWGSKIETWRVTARWCLVAGTLGAAAAVLSGLRAEAVAKHSFEIHQVMEQHKQFGIAVLAGSLLLSVYGLLDLRRPIPFPRAAYVTILFLVVATLSLGAHLGGRLVYEFGVGGSFGRQELSLPEGGGIDDQ